MNGCNGGKFQCYVGVIIICWHVCGLWEGWIVTLWCWKGASICENENGFETFDLDLDGFLWDLQKVVSVLRKLHVRFNQKILAPVGMLFGFRRPSTSQQNTIMYLSFLCYT